MKEKSILFITHTYRSFIKDQIEELAKSFSEVYVIVRYKPIAEISKIIPLNSLKNHRKDYVLDLKDVPSNISIYTSPVWYLPTLSDYARLGERHYKSVKKIIKKQKLDFDLIHSHSSWTSGYVGSRLKREYSVPFVLTTHGYDIYDLPFKGKKWTGRIRDVINRADENITVGPGMIKYYERLGIKPSKVNVIGNGFNSKLFYKIDKNLARKKLGLPLEKKIILTVGNLVNVKGHKYLIEAMNIVSRQNKDTICIIIGGGALKGALEKQIKKLGLEDSVLLLGSRPHDEINDWMNACDIFVLPSISESFGVVQVEAMTCGKPVVATRNGGSEYVIKNEKLGTLCEKKKPSGLADALLSSLNNEWDPNYIMEYAKKFKWNEIARDINSIYLKTIGI